MAAGGALEVEAVIEGKRDEEVVAAADAAGGAPKSEPAEAAGADVAGVDPKPPKGFAGADAVGAGVAPKGLAGAEAAAGAEPKLE